MFTIEAGGRECKIRYGINSFADTDLMDRTQWLIENMTSQNEDVDQGKMLREMVVCLRDLIYTGAMRYSPFDDLAEVGDFIDDYIDEHSEEEDVIMNLFGKITEELIAEGFLGDLLKTAKKAEKPKKQVGRKAIKSS